MRLQQLDIQGLPHDFIILWRVVFNLYIGQMSEPNSNEKSFLELCNQTHSKHSWTSSDKIDRDFTNEENYEEMLQVLHFSKKMHHQLNNQLKELQANSIQEQLSDHIQELRELSDQNQYLRDKYNELSKQQITAVKERTPRPRKSITNMFSTRNQENQVELEIRESFKKIEFKGQKSSGMARSSVQTPRHQRRESQLTERSNQPRRSINGSHFFEETRSYKRQNSLKRAANHSPPRSVFVNILQSFIQEEITFQKECTEDLGEECHSKHNQHYRIKFVHEIQDNIHKTNKRLENLTMVTQVYQSEIKAMNLDFSAISTVIKELKQLKLHYLHAQAKVEGMELLKQQVKGKQAQLEECMNTSNPQSFEVPESVKLMLKVWGTQVKGTAPEEFPVYLKQVLEETTLRSKESKKKVKIREMLDGIKESKNKFEEILLIYQNRVQKMETKLKKMEAQFYCQ